MIAKKFWVLGKILLLDINFWILLFWYYSFFKILTNTNTNIIRFWKMDEYEYE